MDNKLDDEIRVGDEFFADRDLGLVRRQCMTTFKNYTCTMSKEFNGSRQIYFLDDAGCEEWHWETVLTKVRGAAPVTPVLVPHKWADVIHQWADGAEIEIKLVGYWEIINTPTFHPDFTYRVKPSAEDIQQETNKKIQQEVDKQYAKMTVAFNTYMAVSKSGQEYINNLKLGIK